MGEPAMAPASQEEVPQVLAGPQPMAISKLLLALVLPAPTCPLPHRLDLHWGLEEANRLTAMHRVSRVPDMSQADLAAYHIPQTKLAALAQRARQSLSGMHDAHSD